MKKYRVMVEFELITDLEPLKASVIAIKGYKDEHIISKIKNAKIDLK